MSDLLKNLAPAIEEFAGNAADAADETDIGFPGGFRVPRRHFKIGLPALHRFERRAISKNSLIRMFDDVVDVSIDAKYAVRNSKGSRQPFAGSVKIGGFECG